jgi:hypothetical protein
MAVAHDQHSESHTGATGHSGSGSFTWNHTPVGTPKGVVVFVHVVGAGFDYTTGVTYGGVAMTAVSAAAIDGLNEQGSTKGYFLGSGIPTGTQAIVVTRTNNATVMYASAATLTAATDTELKGSVVSLANDRAGSEQTVGSAGVQSLGYAGCYYGGGSPAGAGANSTLLTSIDFGAFGCSMVRETGSGSTGTKAVGFTGASDDWASIHFAVGEAATSDVTVGITNVVATGAVGTLAPSSDKALTNVLATGSVGSVAVGSNDVTLALTGVGATGSVGDLTDHWPIRLKASTNIAASAATATTAQLTAPAGKTTADFLAGRISDDTNPLPSINLGADEYTELEWSIEPSDLAQAGDVYEFRVTKAGTVIDTYTVTPSFTVGGGADVEVALTGVASTGAVGSVAPSTSKALTSASGTGAVGDLGVTKSGSLALTGVGGTGAVGTASPGAALALTSVTGTGAAGTSTPSSTAAVTGNVGTGAAGTVSPALALAVSGNAATGSVGDVTGSVSASGTEALTGVDATGDVGVATPSTTVALSGVSATGAVGSLAPALAASLSGVGGTGSVGSFNPALALALSGLGSTGAIGSLAVTQAVALTGTAATGEEGDVGTIVGGDVTVALTGVSTTTSVGFGPQIIND